jgi:hypothetical protein
MLIAVINESTLVTNDQVNLMCQAIQTQLNLHVLPAWNMKSGSVQFYADKNKVPGYAWVVSMLDNSTQAGALGYHAEDNDKIDAFIFAGPVLQNGGVALYDATNPQNVSVASVLSHEVCEMVGDRFAGFWSDGPPVVASDGQTYTEYALELCDPVEGDSYVITVGTQKVSVSNFVFPSWFNAQATAPLNLPFDYLGKLTKPFSMTKGGYLIVRQSGNSQQVFGENVKPEKQLAVKTEWYRR